MLLITFVTKLRNYQLRNIMFHESIFHSEQVTEF